MSFSPAHSSPDRILVVDDSPDNCFLIQAILEYDGYIVEFANSGKQALAKIEDQPPELLLLDVMMPEMDGFEVTRRLRENPRLGYFPILLITASEHPRAAMGLDSGADDFIRKPVSPDELTARVRSLLRLKHSIDERDRIARQREDFVSRLTHDLRTPLVAADRMLTLILEGRLGAISEQVQEMLATMQRSNENLVTMVNLLLEVYRYESGRKPLSLTQVELGELIREVLQELMPLALSKGLSLEAQLPDGAEVSVLGDRLELRRVLTNLVGNALKFTDQGWVQVRLRASNTGNDAGAVLEVEDTGPGITVADQVMLFDSFRTSRHHQAGSGLGLNLSRRIVQAHQGRIEVESHTANLPNAQNPELNSAAANAHEASDQPDSAPKVSGSTFRVYLPFQPSGSVEATTTSPANGKVSHEHTPETATAS